MRIGLTALIVRVRCLRIFPQAAVRERVRRFAGLERIVHYIESLRFSDEDIAYLAKQEEKYKPEFLEELRRFRFQGNIHSMKEGAGIPERTAHSGGRHHFRDAAGRNRTLELHELSDLDRNQGLPHPSGGRRRYVAGVWHKTRAGSGCGRVGSPSSVSGRFPCHLEHAGRREFGIPTKGTHAHSWVQTFRSEQEAFDILPRSCRIK